MLWIFFLSCSFVNGFSGRPADPSDQSEIVVTVPEGATARSMGSVLEAAGAIDNADGEFCPEFEIPCTVELDFTGLVNQ